MILFLSHLYSPIYLTYFICIKKHSIGTRLLVSFKKKIRKFSREKKLGYWKIEVSNKVFFFALEKLQSKWPGVSSPTGLPCRLPTLIFTYSLLNLNLNSSIFLWIFFNRINEFLFDILYFYICHGTILTS